MHLIFDGHLDIAMNALRYERDQRLPVAQIREREAKLSGDEPGTCTTSVEEMRRANVAVVVTTVIARTKAPLPPERPAPRYGLDHPTQDMAYASAMGQLAYYTALAKQGQVRIIRDGASLAAHLAVWRKPVIHPKAPVGVIITMECADPIVEPEELSEWWLSGLRSLMLAHFGAAVHAYGTPGKSGEEGPVTEKGRRLLAEMSKLKMPLDLTHLCDRSFFDAVDLFDGVVYSSHTNCRTLAPTPRQLTDEQIRIILERDGVLGVALHNGMLRGPINGDSPTRRDVGLEHVALHIDHICQLAGDARHAAIGSDLDGGFGTEQAPSDLDTVADLHKLGPYLTARGYGQADIAGILGGNWLHFWSRALPA